MLHFRLEANRLFAQLQQRAPRPHALPEPFFLRCVVALKVRHRLSQCGHRCVQRVDLTSQICVARNLMLAQRPKIECDHGQWDGHQRRHHAQD